MKKVSIIGLFIIVVALPSHAQSVFSKQNLEQASQDDLSLYLKQAKSQKITGIVLSSAGIAAVTSLVLVANSEVSMSLDTAEVIFIGGTAATLIGIPLMIIGSSRVKKVKNTLSDRVSIELAPCSFQNFTTQDKQHGVTFKLKF